MSSVPVHAMFFTLCSLCGCVLKRQRFYQQNMSECITIVHAYAPEQRYSDSDISSKASPESLLVCLCLLVLIGHGALPGTLHRRRDSARADLHRYVCDSSADCCGERSKPSCTIQHLPFRQTSRGRHSNPEFCFFSIRVYAFKVLGRHCCRIGVDGVQEFVVCQQGRRRLKARLSREKG